MKRPIVVALTCAGCVGSGCLPDPQPVSFEPVDLAKLAHDLANPTAEVDETTVAELEGPLSAHFPAVGTLFEFVGEVLAKQLTNEALSDGLTWRALQGTNVYVRLACPGPDPEAPDTSFEWGYVRIDSPTLTDEFVESVQIRGDAWLTHRQCRIGSFEYEGGFAMHYDVDRELLALDTRFDYVDYEHGDTAQHVRWPMRGQPHTGYQILVTLESGGTVVLEVLLATPGLWLRGANGTFGCSLDVQTPELSCPDL